MGGVVHSFTGIIFSSYEYDFENVLDVSRYPTVINDSTCTSVGLKGAKKKKKIVKQNHEINYITVQVNVKNRTYSPAKLLPRGTTKMYTK